MSAIEQTCIYCYIYVYICIHTHTYIYIYMHAISICVFMFLRCFGLLHSLGAEGSASISISSCWTRQTIVHARSWWWGFDILNLNILRSCQQKHIQCLLNRLIGSSPTNSTRVFLRVGYRTETFWCNTSRLDAPCHFWSSLNTSLVMQFHRLKSKKVMNRYEKRCCIQVPHMDSILALVAWRWISCLGKNTQWQ